MRAIINFVIQHSGAVARGDVERTRTMVIDYLDKIGWTPSTGQDHTETIKAARDLINHIAENQRGIAEATHFLTIIDPATQTWGIVSAPTHTSITIRLKNPIADRLKRACETLVEKIINENKKNKSFFFKQAENHITLKPMETISVLEPNSDTHAYTGTIVANATFTLAKSERRPEFIVFVVSFLLAISAMWYTSPWSGYFTEGMTEGSMTEWKYSTAARLSTAFLVTAFVSFSTVSILPLGGKRTISPPTGWASSRIP